VSGREEGREGEQVSERAPQRFSIIWQDTKMHGPGVLTKAAEIVRDYTDKIGRPPTLRKLFYKLVGMELPNGNRFPNDKRAYSYLAELTKPLRLNDKFPDLTDETREISRPFSFGSPEEAREWVARIYERDRAATQPYNIYVACEKNGTAGLLKHWYHERGIAVVGLGGEAPTQLIKEMHREILKADKARPRRESIILYAGDYDASGEGIARRFEADLRLKCHSIQFNWVGLSKDQVRAHHLPEAPEKEGAPAPDKLAFFEKNGESIQVELDALDEADLRALFDRALEPYWNERVYQRTLKREHRERASLKVA
jgi:hypothetical protein